MSRNVGKMSFEAGRYILVLLLDICPHPKLGVRPVGEQDSCICIACPWLKIASYINLHVPNYFTYSQTEKTEKLINDFKLHMLTTK